MQRVLILRHGQSEWNVERRWQGWLDSSLTAAGERQAASRARALAHDGVNPRAVFSSDLVRARRTAEIIAAHLEVPILTDEGFRERHGGEWEGHTSDEIEVRWPGMRERWRNGELTAPPGGEEDDAVLARFDAALGRALRHVGTNLLVIVTHHGVLRLAATRAGMDVHALIPNVGGYWFDVEHAELHSPEPLGPVVLDGEHAALE
jgi:broad specificity phosphatase PhoE